jgi:hypothetical protein
VELRQYLEAMKATGVKESLDLLGVDRAIRRRASGDA